MGDTPGSEQKQEGRRGTWEPQRCRVVGEFPKLQPSAEGPILSAGLAFRVPITQVPPFSLGPCFAHVLPPTPSPFCGSRTGVPSWQGKPEGARLRGWRCRYQDQLCGDLAVCPAVSSSEPPCLPLHPREEWDREGAKGTAKGHLVSPTSVQPERLESRLPRRVCVHVTHARFHNSPHFPGGRLMMGQEREHSG